MAANNRMQPPNANGSVPNPDPTDRTIEQLLREISTSREIVEAKTEGNLRVLETRLEGMDTAILLLQKASEQIPSWIKDEVRNLRHLHGERFDSVNEKMELRFGAISTQFQERDKRTEQLSIADKTAIAAALQAQKEAAGSTTEMIIAAITKMDTNFTKLIEQTQTLLVTQGRNTDEKINDVKGRVDRGEGRGSVSDPAITDALQKLNMGLQHSVLSGGISEGKGVGQREMIAWLLALGGLLVSVFANKFS